MVHNSNLIAAAFVPAALAAKMSLTGTDSFVSMNGASLTASCLSDGDPKIVKTSLNRRFNSYDSSETITAYLSGVAPTCAGSEITKPCAGSVERDDEPTFYCVWTGEAGTVRGEAQYANLNVIKSSDVTVGLEASVTCALPAENDFLAMTMRNSGFYSDRALTLSLKHYAPMAGTSYEADAMNIPFAGKENGDKVYFSIDAPSPPAPPPPPSPLPSPPPPAFGFANNYGSEMPANGYSGISAIRVYSHESLSDRERLNWPIAKMSSNCGADKWYSFHSGCGNSNGDNTCRSMCRALGLEFVGQSNPCGGGYGPGASTAQSYAPQCAYNPQSGNSPNSYYCTYGSTSSCGNPMNKCDCTKFS